MSSFCNPNKVKYNPDRFRLPDIDHPDVIEMADSIKEIGQLLPILVDSDMYITDGFTRVQACKRLNRDVWYATEEEGRIILNSPLLKRVAELHANVKRKDFTPLEKSRAIAEVDRLMREVHGDKKTGFSIAGGWTGSDTAKKLGYKSHGTISDAITIDKAVRAGTVPGLERAKTMQEAKKMVVDAARLEASKLLASRQTPDDEIGDPTEYFSSRLLLGDCLTEMKKLDPKICSMFITDPPFGLSLDKLLDRRGSTIDRTRGVYGDENSEILSLIKSVITEMARVGKPACQVIMFCGIEFWHILLDWFEEVGFKVHKKPLIWVKASKDPFRMTTGRTNAPSTNPASSYEAMLYARRGDATLAKQGLGDVFVHQTLPSIDKCHVAQKPVPLMEEIISRFYHIGTNPLLIDPFAGSGTTLIAARRLGIKQYFGYELDPENRDRAIAFMVNQYMREKESPLDETPIDLGDFK